MWRKSTRSLPASTRESGWRRAQRAPRDEAAKNEPESDVARGGLAASAGSMPFRSRPMQARVGFPSRNDGWERAPPWFPAGWRAFSQVVIFVCFDSPPKPFSGSARRREIRFLPSILFGNRHSRRTCRSRAHSACNSHSGSPTPARIKGVWGFREDGMTGGRPPGCPKMTMQKRPPGEPGGRLVLMAGCTRLELATSDVTGRRSNQLS